MKKLLLPLLLISFHTVLFSQTTGSIKGKITDKQTNAPLPGATVTVKGSLNAVINNNEGYFKLSKLNVGKIILVISYVGYENMELSVNVSNSNTTIADAALTLDERMGNTVVITASKRPEKITNAPASIQVIGRKELE